MSENPRRVIVNGDEQRPVKKIRASDVGLNIEEVVRLAQEARKAKP